MKICEYNTRLDSDRLPILAETRKYDVKARIASSPESIYDLAVNTLHMDLLADEYLYVIVFDSKLKIKGLFEVSHGTSSATLVDMKSIFSKVLMLYGDQIVLLHNHPSGDCTPSKYDDDITYRAKGVGDLLGIKLIDHVIVGENCYYSYENIGRLE